MRVVVCDEGEGDMVIVCSETGEWCEDDAVFEGGVADFEGFEEVGCHDCCFALGCVVMFACR